MKFLIKIIMISVVLMVLIRYFFNLKSILRSFKPLDQSELVIAILSAPENFEQRSSIRETWIKLVSSVSAKYFFLIGQKNCNVHPLDRLNPYSCAESNVDFPKDVSSKTTFSTVKKEYNVAEQCEPVIGFAIYVIFDIVITELGVTRRFLERAKSTVRVKVISAFDKSTLGSVTFAPGLNETNGTFVSKKIKPVRLPEGYEAMVLLELVEDGKILEDCGKLTWNSQPGVLKITHVFRKGKRRPEVFKSETCSHVFMNYNIPDGDKIKKFMSLKKERRKEQQEWNEKLFVKLKHEKFKFNDIMFLDVIDVYDNLTEKMIQFYLRIMKENNFNYILKTDDDSFVDLLRVYNQLKIVENNSTRISMWWWSYFKKYWAVPDAGKWIDDKYQSISYPPFPCGGGYVLNKDIITYITNNFNNLEKFKGEDVSLGIWLAGLSVRKPEKFSTNDFIQSSILKKFNEINQFKFMMLRQCQDLRKAVDACDWTCDNNKVNSKPHCNKVQLSVREMFATWEDYKAYGYL